MADPDRQGERAFDRGLARSLPQSVLRWPEEHDFAWGIFFGAGGRYEKAMIVRKSGAVEVIRAEPPRG